MNLYDYFCSEDSFKKSKLAKKLDIDENLVNLKKIDNSCENYENKISKLDEVIDLIYQKKNSQNDSDSENSNKNNHLFVIIN